MQCMPLYSSVHSKSCLCTSSDAEDNDDDNAEGDEDDEDAYVVQRCCWL